MQYMGGKSRIARYIAEIINTGPGCLEKRGKKIWQLKYT